MGCVTTRGHQEHVTILQRGTGLEVRTRGGCLPHLPSFGLHLVVVICMIAMLAACMEHEPNIKTGNEIVLKSTAKEVFKDKGPAVVRLAEAAAKGDQRTVHDLVQQGVDVNAQGESGFSILQWALLNKNIDGMLALLEAGADPALTDEWGSTVMHYAAGMEDPTPLHALLDAGVNPDLRDSLNGQTPIFEAIINDREPQFSALLAIGTDLNAQTMIGEGLKTGARPLHRAATTNPRLILPLLEAGADPQAVDGLNATFQSYLNLRNTSVATDEFIENKRKIEAWLTEHGVALERDRTNTADKADADALSPQ